MWQWNEALLDWYLGKLTTNDTTEVANTLWVIAQLGRPKPQPLPTGNSEVIAHLEQLIKDNRNCIVDWMTPPSWGELRWLASRVLACEYAYLGVEKTIILKDVIQPISDLNLYNISQEHQIQSLDELIQRGHLPTKTEIIDPQDYCEWCSKEAVEKRQKQDKDE